MDTKLWGGTPSSMFWLERLFKFLLVFTIYYTIFLHFLVLHSLVYAVLYANENICFYGRNYQFICLKMVFSDFKVYIGFAILDSDL